jgi:hypothetical protein
MSRFSVSRLMIWEWRKWMFEFVVASLVECCGVLVAEVDCFGCLIIHHIDFWFKSFADQIAKVLLYASKMCPESSPAIGAIRIALVL